MSIATKHYKKKFIYSINYSQEVINDYKKLLKCDILLFILQCYLLKNSYYLIL